MLYTILIVFLMAVIAPVVCRWRFAVIGWLLALVPFIFFILFCCQIPEIVHGLNMSEVYPWLPSLGIDLSFYLDGLSLIFALLITGIGTLIVLYSFRYLNDHRMLGRYFIYLFLFMGSMLGAVLSSNLISLFVFWELTGITSYLLISFDNELLESRKAAFQGLLITAAGGLAMLVGFILINVVTGHFSFAFLFNEHSTLVKSPFYIAMVILVLLGAFTKSAQYPFHFWLPNAMRAPTPVSAYLHSATMVQLGIYLVARLTPILGHTPLWSWLIMIVASITMMVGAVLALRAEDLKQILAYSTIMALGTLLFLLAPGTKLSVEAAMTFLLAHALYKAGLFLSAGNIDHAAHTREIGLLGGLRRAMPMTFLAVLLTAASMAGLPPVLGFISKELVYTAKIAEPSIAWLLVAIAFITNMVFVLVALLMFIKPFFGKDKRKGRRVKPHEMSFSLWFCPLIVGLLGVLFGLFPGIIDGNIIAPAASSILQNPITSNLKLWHGISPSLIISLMTYVAAIAVYFAYRYIHRVLQATKLIDIIAPEALYYFCLTCLGYMSWFICNLSKIAKLRNFNSIVFSFLFLLVGGTFFSFKHLAPDAILPDTSWFNWVIAILMFVAAIAVVLTPDYLAGLTFLSITGLGSTLIFLIYSAPDVAMTQILVDILTIVIVVLALYRLPRLPKPDKVHHLVAMRHAIIAILVGAVITMILLSVVSVPFDQFVSNYFSKKSFPLAKGKNIVNVILVDFRAFDTFGEMIVVGIAALGVFSLLKSPKRKDDI